VDIWKTLAERHIALTKPREYEVAGGYLLKIHRAMKQMGKEKEWKRYLAELRQANIRKKRFIEVVDRLEKKRILQE
jgi:uncharacterized Zn finger protein